MGWSDSSLISKGYNPDGTRRSKSNPIAHDAVDVEGELHKQILDYCRPKRWPCVHSRMDVPQTADIGTPDFVIAMPSGRSVWVEAKAKAGKLSTAQLAWQAMLKAVGHEAYVVRSFREFLEIVES